MLLCIIKSLARQLHFCTWHYSGHYFSLEKPSKQSTSSGYLTLLVYRFTISANTVCRQQMTEAKLLQALQVTLVLYILKLLHFNSNIISNQIKYYLWIERSFSRYSMDFTGMLCRFTISYDELLLKKQVPRTQGSSGMQLLGASWWKVIKALSLYEIFHVSLCFWQEELIDVICSQ